MLSVLSIAGLTIPVGPLFWVLAFSLGSEVGGRAIGYLGAESKPSQQAQWQGLYSQVGMVALAIGLLVGRLAYALKFYPLYLATPQLLFSIRPGALAAIPGIIAAVVVMVGWLKRHKVALSAIADATAVGFAAAVVVVKVGQFLTGVGYGLPTEAPWGVMLWGTMRHPVQIYEAVSWLGIWCYLRWNLRRVLPGETFWRLVVVGTLSVLVLEAFHATSATWFVGVRMPQVVALGSLLVGLYVLSFYVQQKAARSTLLSEKIGTEQVVEANGIALRTLSDIDRGRSS